RRPSRMRRTLAEKSDLLAVGILPPVWRPILRRRRHMGGITRRKLLVGAAATPIVVATGVAVADSMAATVVTPSNTVVGPGLPLFGLNMGHYMPGSNTTAWIRYSRINAARV